MLCAGSWSWPKLQRWHEADADTRHVRCLAVVVEVVALVARLELDLWTSRVCLPCLTFIAFPLDSGDVFEAQRQARRLRPELWEDGLEETTIELLEQARRAGVANAAEASLDARRRGATSAVAAAVVWRLAELMVEDMRAGRERPERRRTYELAASSRARGGIGGRDRRR